MNRTAFVLTADVLVVSFCGWILFHGDFLVLVFLALPAALLALLLALPTLGFEGKNGLIAGAIIALVVNLAIVFAGDLKRAGESIVPVVVSVRDLFVAPTHYVSAPSTVVEWWPKPSSQGRTSQIVSHGACVKVTKAFAGGDYARVVVFGLNGSRYIRRDDLERIEGSHKCDEQQRIGTK